MSKVNEICYMRVELEHQRFRRRDAMCNDFIIDRYSRIHIMNYNSLIYNFEESKTFM